jgi:hypothetical protein
MGASDFSCAKSRKNYQASHSGGYSPGFLTPPSPYEGRRDSNASSQASMSSFASYSSDFSIPATPTYGPSPLGGSFVDIMSEIPMNGLLTHPLQKGLAPGEGFDDWTMVQSTEQSAPHSSPFHPQSMLPTTGDFGSLLQAQSGEHHHLNGSSWGNDTTLSWSDARQTVFPFDGRLPEQCTLWSNEMLQPQSMFGQTMTPSASLLLNDNYVQVSSDPYDSSTSFDNAGLSFPQSPQEVCFKREDSVLVKQEPGLDEMDLRPRRSIHVSRTGAKSIVKEGGIPKKKKKKSKASKARDYLIYHSGHLIDVRTEVERAGPDHPWQPIERATRSECQCTWEDENGVRCPKIFKRQEHMKRHHRTHDGDAEHSCLLCMKKFGRNDNCQDHYYTHVKKPGKKEGRNEKYPLREVEEMVVCSEKGPKLVEKLRAKWRTDYGDLPADCIPM